MTAVARPSALLLLVALAMPVASRDHAGSSAGSALLRGHVGARPAAMGGAYTGLATGPLSLRYNAAGLAGESAHRILFQHHISIMDVSRSDLSYSRPLFSGGFAAGVSYIDYDDIVRTTTTNKVNAGTFGASDLLFHAGYGWSPMERLTLGATLGIYQLEIDDRSASGITADLGAQYRFNAADACFGVSIRNLGTRARFISANEELPLSLAIGAAFQPASRVTVSAEYEFVARQRGAVRGGIEFRPVPHAAFRLGYDGANDAGGGLTCGAGFRFDGFDLDYAYVPLGKLGEEHRISTEYRFGATERITPAGRVSRPPATPASALAVTADPTALRVIELGNARMAAGDDIDAAELFAIATEYDPDLWDAWQGLGVAQYRLKDYAAARDALLAAQRLRPESDATRSLLRECNAHGDPSSSSGQTPRRITSR